MKRAIPSPYQVPIDLRSLGMVSSGLRLACSYVYLNQEYQSLSFMNGANS